MKFNGEVWDLQVVGLLCLSCDIVFDLKAPFMWGDESHGVFLDHWELKCPYKPRDEKKYYKGYFVVLAVGVLILSSALAAIWFNKRIWI